MDDDEQLDDHGEVDAADDLSDGTIDPAEVDPILDPWDEGADDEL